MLYELILVFIAGSIALAWHSDRKKNKKAPQKPVTVQKCIRCAQTPIMTRVEADAAIRDAAARTEAVATVALTLGAHMAYEGMVDEPDEDALLAAKKTCADLGIDWNF